MFKNSTLIRMDREFSASIDTIRESYLSPAPLPMVVGGLAGGAVYAYLTEAVRDALGILRSCQARAPLLILVATDEEREAVTEQLCLADITALGFKWREPVVHNISASHDIDRERLSVLSRILAGSVDAVVSTPEAALSLTMPPEVLRASSLSISISDDFPRDDLAMKLSEMGFRTVDAVEERGQLAVRGGILDFWGNETDMPIRVEYFGDEIDRITLFDPISQRSVGNLTSFEALPCEEITIRSHDGLTLFGRYYRFSDDESRMEILFHGWRSNTFRDACGGAKIARDAGYNFLVVDQRAHGKSDGNTITFGVKEKYDCLDWVNYAIKRFGPDVRILLGGISMGAATVLMASALPLPKNVCGITGDCGYSSPEAIIRKVCRDMKIPDRLGYPFVRMSARVFGHFSLDGESAVEAVRHAKVPIMLLHGEADDFVPFPMAGEIYDAIASKKQILTVPNAGHGLAYFYDTEYYVRELSAFKVGCLDGKI